MATQPTYVARKDEDAEFDNVDVAGDLAVTGASTFTGAITASAGVVGGIQLPVTAVTADGAIAVPSVSTTYAITKAGVAAMTLVDPTATTHDGIELTFIATTANAHTLDLVTGINGGAADVGTFGGAAGDGVTIVAYQGVWYQKPGNNTNVTFA